MDLATVRLGTLFSLPLAMGLWIGLAGHSRRVADCARILTFHGTPRARVREYERQLKYLRRQFRVVTLSEVVDAMLAGERRLSGLMALTFDDGLRSNVDVMYPLLRDLRMPATFFVCPQLIDERRWLWNVEARKRLQSLASPALVELAAEVGAPQDSDSFVEWMKTLALAERQAVEQRIRDASPAFAPTAAMREACDLATWDELRALDPSVVTIGSHTATHAILSRLTPEQVEQEVGGSRRAIEAKLGRTADLFCYPNGDQNRLVRDAVARHYRAAVSTVPAFLRRGADRFMMPRVDAPEGAVRLCWNMHHRNFFPAAGF